MNGPLNGERNLKITVANIPSSYNSTNFVNNNFGIMAAVGELKKPVPDDIKIVSHTFYDNVVIFLKDMREFIIKINDSKL